MIVVFDMDDTLYLERDFVMSGLRAADRWAATALGATGLFEATRALFAQGQRERLFDQALISLGMAVEPELIAKLVEVYRSHRPEIRLAEDACRVLARRAEWDGIALLTDGYQLTQEHKIEALGLRESCDPVITTDSWGRDYWKPHSRGFLAIQRCFEQPPASFMYVADNPLKDFLAPRSLGWKTIRIRRPGGLHADLTAAPGHDADLTISSLDELASDDIRRALAEGRKTHALTRPEALA
jgi:putative hydrolase of the HAD superfamily